MLTRPAGGTDGHDAGGSDQPTPQWHTGDDDAVIDVVGEVVGTRGISGAQVALAWLLSKPAVTARIVGATRISHLEDAVGSVDIALTAHENQSRGALSTAADRRSLIESTASRWL